MNKKICQLKNTVPASIADSAKCKIPEECNTCCWFITKCEFVDVEIKIKRLIDEAKINKYSNRNKVKH